MNTASLIGKVLHDTHEVRCLVGKGGMGAVYEARHVHLNKRFAVKVLNTRYAEDENVFTRFKREALIASSLGHPAIVQVVDFYFLEDGRPCMVMEYLEGRDLGKELKAQGRLQPAEVSLLVEQVAGALQAVHAREIVHRDMKPGNIYLTDQPGGERQVKVLDFGISKFKIPGEDFDTLTTNHQVMGTPSYMSPEQALGEVGDVDWRTDIFALGTITYAALSGKLPFTAPSLQGVLVKIQSMEPRPVTTLVPGLSERVDHVLRRAMAKDKVDRYQQAGTFAADLRAALQEESGAVTTEMPVAKELPAASDEPQVSLTSHAATGPNVNATSVVPVEELLEESGATGPSLPAPSVEDEPPPEVGADTTLSAAAGEQETDHAGITRSWRPLLLGVMAGAALLVLVVGAAYFALRGPGTADEAVAASSPLAPLAAAKKAPASEPRTALAPKVQEPLPAPRPETISLTLRITPSTAEVYLDGEPRTGSPIRLARTNQPLALRVLAPGYKAHEQVLLADQDRTLEIILQEERVEPRPGLKKQPPRVRPPAPERPPPWRVDKARPEPRPADPDEAFETL